MENLGPKAQARKRIRQIERIYDLPEAILQLYAERQILGVNKTYLSYILKRIKSMLEELEQKHPLRHRQIVRSIYQSELPDEGNHRGSLMRYLADKIRSMDDLEHTYLLGS